MTLDQLYPTTLTQRPSITNQEWNRRKVRVENYEKLGIASIQIQEHFEVFQQENHVLNGQVVEITPQSLLKSNRSSFALNFGMTTTKTN